MTGAGGVPLGCVLNLTVHGLETKTQCICRYLGLRQAQAHWV